MGWRIKWRNGEDEHSYALMSDRVELWTDESEVVTLETLPDGWQWATLEDGEEGAEVVWHHSPRDVELWRSGEVIRRGTARKAGRWPLQSGDRIRFGASQTTIEIVATSSSGDDGVEFVGQQEGTRPEEGEEMAHRMWSLHRRLAMGQGWSTLLKAVGEWARKALTMDEVDGTAVVIWEGEEEFYHHVIWCDDCDGNAGVEEGPRRGGALASLLTRKRVLQKALRERREVVCRSQSDGSIDLLLPLQSSDGEFVGAYYLAGVPGEGFDAGAGWSLLHWFGPAAVQLIRRYRCDDLRKNFEEENRYFRERERRHYLFKDLVCESEVMLRVYDELHERVDDEAPILMTGEAGTGKELLARALHHLGDRQEAMLIRMDCADFPRDMVGLELFGCVASELTGAVAARKGIFELAEGGTVFLDEIDRLSPMTQGKLVRVIEEKEVRRLGDAVGRPVEARLIASSHRDLEELCDQGRFRRDLYEVLRDHVMRVPPLRQRREDILPLARIFLKTFSDRYDARCERMSEGFQKWLLDYKWPGNVRQLQTMVEAAVLMARDKEVIERSALTLEGGVAP